MIVGKTPFTAENNKTTWKMVRNEDPSFPSDNHPSIQMSAQCRDFIEKCLDKNPKTRIGSINDSKEVMEHPWFEIINDDYLLEKRYEVPFIPDPT